MVVKVLKKGTTLLIETSSDSKWILNKRIGKLLRFELDRILIVTSRFDEIGLKGSCLHLDDNSTHEKEVGVSNL